MRADRNASALLSGRPGRVDRSTETTETLTRSFLHAVIRPRGRVGRGAKTLKPRSRQIGFCMTPETETPLYVCECSADQDTLAQWGLDTTAWPSRVASLIEMLRQTTRPVVIVARSSQGKASAMANKLVSYSRDVRPIHAPEPLTPDTLNATVARTIGRDCTGKGDIPVGLIE